MMNIIFRSSLFSIHSKYLLYSYRNYLTDLSQYTNSLSHPYIQQNNRRFSIVFFPNYFSMQNEKKFCWEWFFILLRMIYQSAENDLSFGAELFMGLYNERKLKDGLPILHPITNYTTNSWRIVWKMKALFAKFLCGRYVRPPRRATFPTDYLLSRALWGAVSSISDLQCQNSAKVLF